MLYLQRKGGEQIVIGRDIVVTVVKCAGNVVRLGITAPPEVSIRRHELIERLTADKRQAPGDTRCEGTTLSKESNGGADRFAG
jgi:carbon storage regulator